MRKEGGKEVGEESKLTTSTAVRSAGRELDGVDGEGDQALAVAGVVDEEENMATTRSCST